MLPHEAGDNCGQVTVTQVPAAGTALPVGQHLVTLTATDECGNSTSKVVTLTVTDDQNCGILLQKTVPVLPGDDPDTLAARVFEAECAAYPEAIRLHTDRLGR